ncbi:MAG: hypothetical protein J3Q66DRAFT_424615 [Benniella sp.]|nr:MAG: hypothetical protein J3Q66DRAFT_424615 [Benniella sp.]
MFSTTTYDRVLNNDDHGQATELRSIHESQDCTNGSRQPIHISFDGTSMKYLASKTIQDDGGVNFDARIPHGEMEHGYYNIVWCVAPWHNGQVPFEKLVFEVEVASTNCKLWAKISKDEIESIETRGCLRLRLQQTLHLRYQSKVIVRLSARMHSPPPDSETPIRQECKFQVHYVELMRLGYETQTTDEVTEHEVKSPGHVLQRFDMSVVSSNAQIIAADISSSGNYIAILSVEQDNAHVSVWKMDRDRRATGAGTGHQHDLQSHSNARNDPMASVAIPLKGAFDIMQCVRIAISSDGSYIALYRQPFDDRLAQGGSAPDSSVLHFQKPQLSHSNDCVVPVDDKKAPRVPSLEWINNSTPDSLKDSFIGFGKFVARDKFRSNDEGGKGRSYGDYFVAVNKSRIAVYQCAYDGDKSWKLLYGIAIGELCSMGSRVKQLEMLHRSIEGPAFVWMEDPQNVSIWDLVSGTNLKYISVNNPQSRHQHEIQHLAVSPGGKLMALAGKGWIRTYFMDSGIEICNTIVHDGKILNIEFLDEDKSILVVIGKPSMEQMSVIMDAMELPLMYSSPRSFPSSSYDVKRFIRTSKETVNGPPIMDTHRIDGLVMVASRNVLETFKVTQLEISNPASRLIGHPDDNTQGQNQELNRHRYTHPESNIEYQLVVDFEEREAYCQQQKFVRVQLYSVHGHEPRRHIMTIVPEPWRLLGIENNDPEVYVKALFLHSWAQFIVTTSLGFQVWNLPDTRPDSRCELALAWINHHTNNTKVDKDFHKAQARVRNGGENVTATWFNHTNSIRTSIRIPKSSWSTPTETFHCINSIPVLAECYTESSTAAKEAIVRYIVRHINHDPPRATTNDSVMTKIAESSKLRCCSDILGAILKSTDGKWVPRCASSDGRRYCKGETINPILILVKESKKVPQCLPMAEQMMDYCIRQAKSQCDPAFVLPVLQCLRMLATNHPDTAIDITRRMAFLPVKNQDFVIDRSILSTPVRYSLWDTIRHKQSTIYDYLNPVFRLKSQLPKIHEGDLSTHINVSLGVNVDPMNKSIRNQVYIAPCSLIWHYESDNNMRSYTGLSETRSCARMIAAVVSSVLDPWGGRSIRANFSELDYFDNPAVEAVICYKWNSAAWKVWILRRALYPAYYALIISVTMLQVFPIMRISDLQGFLYVIICIGLFYLYLEIKRLFTDHRAYLSSVFNFIDMCIFAVPLIGCVELLVSISKYENIDVVGYTGTMSFSLVGIYIHMMLAFRVFEHVGRFDVIENEIQRGDDVSLHLGIALYYLVVFIIFMNVLIAVMNDTISAAHYYGRLDWLSNRLWTVTSAENLSLAAWGYCEETDLSLQNVYYIVPSHRFEEFKKRFQLSDDDDQLSPARKSDSTLPPGQGHSSTRISQAGNVKEPSQMSNIFLGQFDISQPQTRRQQKELSPSDYPPPGHQSVTTVGDGNERENGVGLDGENNCINHHEDVFKSGHDTNVRHNNRATEQRMVQEDLRIVHENAIRLQTTVDQMTDMIGQLLLQIEQLQQR